MDNPYILDLDAWEALTIRLDEEWDQLSHHDLEDILFARKKLMEQAIERLEKSPPDMHHDSHRHADRVASILERDKRIMERMQQKKREASHQIRRLRNTSRQKEGYDVTALGYETESMFFDKKR